MTQSNLYITYTTISSVKEAEILVSKVIEVKLAVCANIIKGGISCYVLEGELKFENEVYIIFKTTAEKSTYLSEFILKEHPYQTPALLSWPTETSEGFYEYACNTLKLG